MATTTLPTFTKRIDDAFTETWYEIKAEAIDNILNATPIMAALKASGCLTPQEGGDLITRTIKHGTGTTKAVTKGDTFSQGEPELETVARWPFRMLSAHVQRDLFTDRENRGKFKIKDYISKRLQAARDALVAQQETDLTQAYSTTAETSDKVLESLNELILPYTEAHAASATYGLITRPSVLAEATGENVSKHTVGNIWWGSKYRQMTLPIEINLVSDMKMLYNGVSDNIEPPNLIVSNLTPFELYEDFALDMSQIVKDTGGQLADLGFDVLRFKGKPWIWSNGLKGSLDADKMQVLMLNTKYIELVYDPGMWFDMTEWKPIPLQGTRIAHILCACNLIGTQPRRQGRLYEA